MIDRKQLVAGADGKPKHYIEVDFSGNRRDVAFMHRPHVFRSSMPAAQNLTKEERNAMLSKERMARNALEKLSITGESEIKKEADRRWGSAKRASSSHPVLDELQLPPHNLKQHDGSLLVPIRNPYCELVNIVTIAPDGSSHCLSGGRNDGYYTFGNVSDGARVIICEDWLSGAVLHKDSDLPVIAAIWSENIFYVAERVFLGSPRNKVIIAATNDPGAPGNDGVIQALTAGSHACGVVLIPQFPPHVTGRNFADLRRLLGVRYVG